MQILDCLSHKEFVRLKDKYDLSNYIECWECEKWVPKDCGDEDTVGNFICGDCLDEHYTRCSYCGNYDYTDEIIRDENGDAYCRDCASQVLSQCFNCNDYIRNPVYDTNENVLCGDCYSNEYYTCSNCGVFIHSDDVYWDRYDDPVCVYCYEENDDIIHEWDYKPEPCFYGHGKRYLGVELEVDRGGENNDNAEQILDIIGNRYAYCKHDGSLDDGFEIVSHPATLDYHMNKVNWEGALQELKDLDYISHDAGTCGIHVHMNRGGFGETQEEQDLGIAKVLFFFERHWENIVKFSRRTYSQLDQWAARYLSGDPEHPEDVLEYAKDDMSRYRCVNLCNHSTVEIRVFRGSLIYETFMAALQFTDLMYDIAKLPLEEVMNITWDDFKEMGSKHKEFTGYLRRRRL